MSATEIMRHSIEDFGLQSISDLYLCICHKYELTCDWECVRLLFLDFRN